MSRTMEGYDQQRERMADIFPGRMSLKVSEVAQAEGIDPRTAKKRFPFDCYGMISIEDYIRTLCLRKPKTKPSNLRRYGGRY